jgi:hypothetical protein
MNLQERLRVWAHWLRLGMLAVAGYSGYGIVGEFLADCSDNLIGTGRAGGRSSSSRWYA